MVARRTSRVIRVGNSLAVVLPKDYCDGEGIVAGDDVEVVYTDEVRIRPLLRPDVSGGSA